MSKNKKDRFLKTPHYVGGNTALKAFIGKHMRYPKAALKAKIEGTVMLKYDIDFKGNVVAAQVKSGVGHGCDEEAVRLVKLLKFEVPKNRKMRVLFHKTIQIHFRLPKEKPIPIPQQKPKPSVNEVQYNYVTTSTPTKKDLKEKPNRSYSYTIDL